MLNHLGLIDLAEITEVLCGMRFDLIILRIINQYIQRRKSSLLFMWMWMSEACCSLNCLTFANEWVLGTFVFSLFREACEISNHDVTKS